MKHLGTYKGITCYECTCKEYINEYKNGRDNGNVIFIIDGEMVRNNVIIGYYDGKTVEDSYDGIVYYKNKTKETKEIKETKEVKKQEVFENVKVEDMVKEINFSDYSGVVDKFFEELKAKG